MKKTWKSIGAIAVSVPMVAFAACGLQKSEDPAATYATFAEKYNAAVAGYAESDLFLDVYETVSVNAEGANGKMSLSYVNDEAYDFASGVITRAAASQKMNMAMTVGETETKSETSATAYLLDGFSYVHQIVKDGENESEIKLKETASTDDTTINPSKFLIFPEGTFEEPFVGTENVVIQANKSNTHMKITADLDPMAIYEYLMGADEVLGEYDYDVEASFTFSVRFDNAGNLLYTEMLMEGKVSIAAAEEAPEENPDEGVEPVSEELDGAETPDGSEAEGGEETPDETPEEEPATPTDNASVRVYRKVSVKDGSTVKAPTEAQLESYKTQEELDAEVPEETPTDGE
ncbi:MAG: hypothetical protein IJY34_00690 [Clostridia bacterium]|nr:hypothetical protein [Clostridia bacterium]